MDIETQDPAGVKGPHSEASTGGVVVPMPSSRRGFKPRSLTSQLASPAPKRKPQGKRDAGGLPFLFSEEMVATGLNGFPLSVRDTGPDSACLMYVWTGTHWKRVGDNQGHARADAWLRLNASEKLTPHLAKQCWDATKLVLLDKRPFPEPSIRAIRIPTRTHTLCVQDDGVVMAVPPNPDFGLEHCLGADLPLPPEGGVYTPAVVSASSNTPFSNWLFRAMPLDEERLVLQELCAQTLMPQAFGIAGWLVGEAGSGKSTVLELLSLVHSKAQRMNLNKLDGEFSLAPLLDASVALADEVKPARFDEEILKTLISQNKVQIARKHIATIGEFRPTCKWMICSNQMPVVHDTSEGVWRRLVFLHFRNVVPECQRNAELHLEFDLREVLDWMLEGVVRIAKRRRMLTHAELPASCRALKDGAKLSSDNVLAWMEGDGVEYDQSASPDWVSCQAIYDRYVAFCQGVGDPISANAFWRTMRERLRAKGITLGQPSNRRGSNGKLTRCQPFTFGSPKEAAPPKLAIPNAALLIEAAKTLDLTSGQRLVMQGVDIDTRCEGHSALGIALNHPGDDELAMAFVRWMLGAGARVQRAGALSAEGQARLLDALFGESESTAAAERSMSELLDDVLGPSSIPDTHHSSTEVRP